MTVPRDQVVSYRMRGVAADWGPFHSRRKREDMASWTRSQSYCTALGRSLRPVARSETLVDDIARQEREKLEVFRPVGRSGEVVVPAAGAAVETVAEPAVVSDEG